MKTIPLNICVFDTAKGHYGRTDIYKKCISDLHQKIPLNNFAYLYAHIKVCPGESHEEIVNWYKERGFEVKVSFGDFKHFQTSHQQEYCKDMITAFNDIAEKAPFTLWLESDWCWDDKGSQLLEFFYEACRTLSEDRNLLSIRFARHLNEVERLNNLKSKHNLDVQAVPYPQNKKLFIHNDNFSCNPNICRTRDLYVASLILKRNFDSFSHHSEMGWTHCLRWMSEAKYPYAIFDPSLVSVLHYGTKEGEEDKSGKVFESLF